MFTNKEGKTWKSTRVLTAHARLPRSSLCLGDDNVGRGSEHGNRRRHREHCEADQTKPETETKFFFYFFYSH